MEKTEFSLQDILNNNDLEFTLAQPNCYKIMDVDMLYKLTIIGVSSNVDQVGMEVGEAAARELARRSQIAVEILRRMPQNE
jgi:hypothetical protein